MQANRHAVLDMMDGEGNVVWSAARDLPAPQRVLSADAARSMNEMLVQIPERGTARRAALSMTRAAGKTGTTQGYRDAWFVGYTGNFTSAVWYGNDSFKPTNKLTGGSLPAMTWQRFMEAAHKGIDLYPIPDIENPLPEPGSTPVAARDDDAPLIVRPPSINADTQRLLSNLSRMMRDAPPTGTNRVAARGEDATAAEAR